MTESLVNLQIQFNANIIRRLRSHSLSADYLGSALFILFALYEKRYDLLDEFDDSNKERRAIILYRQLCRRGLLDEAAEDSKYHYEINSAGIELVEWVKKQIQESIREEVTTESLAPIAETENVEHWIEEYVNLFPERKNKEEKPLRMHAEEALERMKEFIKKFKYDKDTILGATAMYLKYQANSQNGHEYTRTSTYFISKNEKGGKVYPLATWCKNFLDNSKHENFDTSIMDTV